MSVGTRFERLTVIAELPHYVRGSRRYPMVLCRCDCGTEKQVLLQSLTSGNTQSCGCLHVEVLQRMSNGAANLRRKYPREYNSWAQMRSRCTNPNVPEYVRYGGRGITVCQRWASFQAFLDDMGPRPAGHSIDRIDVNGNYTPDNCRWSNHITQCNNTRVNRILTFRGESKTVAEWARALGVHPAKIRARLSRGATAEEALS